MRGLAFKWKDLRDYFTLKSAELRMPKMEFYKWLGFKDHNTLNSCISRNKMDNRTYERCLNNLVDDPRFKDVFAQNRANSSDSQSTKSEVAVQN